MTTEMVRRVPIWNTVGTRVDGVMTATEVLEKGKLDWQVSLQPVYTEVNKKKVLVPGKFATVRSSDGYPLGIVGKGYTPIQNATALNFMDSIVGRGEANYEAVGTLARGSLVWMLAKIPNDGGVDPIDRFLLAVTSHNGVSPIMAAAIDFRIWCANQIQAAIRRAKNKFRIRHTTNAEQRMNEARRVFDGSVAYFNEMDKIFLEMKGIKFTETQLLTLVEKVFAAPGDDHSKRQETRLENIQEKVLELSRTGHGTHLPGVKGTAWGAYNAVTEYLDHYTTIKGGKGVSANEKLLGSSWFGTVSMKTQKTFDALTSMVKLAA